VVASNDTIKNIMKRNIGQFVSKEKELLQEQHAKDIVQKLEDAAKAAQLAQENAVNLEAKRQSVKFTMADNKAKTAMAKIEVVEKAVAATPQRPVVEVWAEAKQAKPPVKPVPLVPTAGQVAQPVQLSQTQVPQPQAGQSTSGPVAAKPQPFGQPSSAAPAANPFTAQPAAQNQAASNTPQPSAVSSLPAKPPPNTGIPQPGAGRGRSASGSGPPGGSGIPRGGSRIGRGRGGQRGGNQQVQTSGFQRQGGPPTGGNSPGGGKGNLNPNAKQFVAGGTGLKRPNEAGQGGNAEKRSRSEQGGQP